MDCCTPSNPLGLAKSQGIAQGLVHNSIVCMILILFRRNCRHLPSDGYNKGKFGEELRLLHPQQLTKIL